MTTTPFAAGQQLAVATPVAAMHSEPRVSSAWTSQLVHGRLVEVLEVRSEWLWVRGEDQYRGWMHRGYMAHSSGHEHEWPISLGCRVDTGTLEAQMPLLARVDPAWALLDGEVVAASARNTRFPAEGSAIADSVVRYFAGASYVWGGTTPWGCDCSGMVQSVFQLHGVSLPRDAYLQAESGVEVRNLEELQPADLLFFSDRDDKRVTHVGIYVGDGKMAHSALGRGGFAVDMVFSSDEEYVRQLREKYTHAVRVTG